MPHKLQNRTPHPISIANTNGYIIRTIHPTAPAFRVDSTVNSLEPIDGIPVVETVLGEANLPEPDGETYYIVSQYVCHAHPERLDLLRPDTTTAIRDDKGRLLAVRALTR